MTGLRVLVADDEAPAREELAWLLGRDPAVGQVTTASNGTEVIRSLRGGHIDALFLDVRMPELDGMDVARLLANFRNPPKVVFVTAYEEHAVEAFDLAAVDYLLKPVRAERLGDAVRRVCQALRRGDEEPLVPVVQDLDETIPVELGGVTRFVQRSDVRYVEAQGDYARLYTASDSHLVRVPLATLEQQWAAAGFVRIHRSHLVALPHVDEMRVESGRWSVRLGDVLLPVSRRHSRDLRDVLVRRARLS